MIRQTLQRGYCDVPSSNIDNCAGVIVTEPVLVTGQMT